MNIKHESGLNHISSYNIFFLCKKLGVDLASVTDMSWKAFMMISVNNNTTDPNLTLRYFTKRFFNNFFIEF